MADPDLQIRERGPRHPDPEIMGGPVSRKKFFRPFGPQFGLKIRRGGGAVPIPWTRQWNSHTNYNTRHKSLKQTPFLSNQFGKNPEIYSSQSFSHWNVSSPSPMLGRAYFEALRPLWYPNQHWERGNGYSCFKILDEVTCTKRSRDQCFL